MFFYYFVSLGYLFLLARENSLASIVYKLSVFEKLSYTVYFFQQILFVLWSDCNHLITSVSALGLKTSTGSLLLINPHTLKEPRLSLLFIFQRRVLMAVFREHVGTSYPLLRLVRLFAPRINSSADSKATHFLNERKMLSQLTIHSISKIDWFYFIVFLCLKKQVESF